MRVGVSVVLLVSFFGSIFAGEELETVTVEPAFGGLGLRTRSYVLKNFQTSVKIAKDEAAFFKWTFTNNASVSTMKRLVITAINRTETGIVSLIQTQFNGYDLLQVPYHPNRRILAENYAYGTVRKTATLLLYMGDLEDGALIDLYIQCSVISSAFSDEESAKYSILLEDIVEEGNIAVAATALVLCIVFLTVVVTWVVLMLDRRRPDEDFYQSFERSRVYLWNGQKAVLQAMGNSYRLFYMAAVYFVPAALYATTMSLQYRMGNQDVCTFNNLCLNPAGWFPVLNNIVSNIPLVSVGFLVLIVVCSSVYENRACPSCRKQSRSEDCEHYSLLMLSGPAIISEALMSSVYHVCPMLQTYEFDIAYTMLLALVGFMYFHTKLRPDRSPSVASYTISFAGHAGYAVYCLLGLMFRRPIWIAMHVLALLLATCILLAGPIYRLATKSEPLPTDRWDLTEFGGMFGIMALFGILVIQGMDPNDWVLMSMGLVVMYLQCLYVNVKWERGEKLAFKCKVFLGLAGCVMLTSLFLFTSGSPTRKELQPWLSREYNFECVMFGIFDTHDVWHCTAALTFFFWALSVMFIDDDLNIEVESHDKQILVK